MLLSIAEVTGQLKCKTSWLSPLLNYTAEFPSAVCHLTKSLSFSFYGQVFVQATYRLEIEPYFPARGVARNLFWGAGDVNAGGGAAPTAVSF